MKQNGLNGGKYIEPFAGGAGLALALLSLDTASDAIINDADYHIYCFWFSVFNDNERFIEKIQNVKISVEEWQNQRAIYSAPKAYSNFDIGFSTFFLNRCNRSGILAGAGPIGGYHQQGKWRLDARFNKDDLIARIKDIGKLKDKIYITNMDAVVFLDKYLSKESDHNNVLVYIDPPYVSAGDRLYLNLYSTQDHKNLAYYLLNQVTLKWIMTYDDNILIRELYSTCQKYLFYIGYSLQSKLKGKELLIAPRWLILPDSKLFCNNKWSIKKEA